MMNGTWDIPAQDELPRIVAMMEDEAFYDKIARVPDADLEAALAGSPDTALWVFRVDGRAVAYAFMTEMATKYPKLDEFGVFERGRGYGKAALDALARKCAKTPRYEKLWLHVVDGNEAAMALYRSLGFGEELFIAKGWKTRSDKVVDQVRMWLKLDRLRRPED
ncbi:GNAT family N-acetyltransferase [Thalassospira australica]|uniref:GNAT family N-acetyltransferase n=1 Tax=Thalassospira australica TaxID=1528106 RepID=UPI00051A1389|nr:GNAT family N-acetyltransferase [Thalassospira australica]